MNKLPQFLIYTVTCILLPIVEIFPDKLTRFHRLNRSTSVLLSDLTTTEVEADTQEEAEAPKVQPGRGTERSPDPGFIQKVLRETRQMLRERNNTANTYNNFRGRREWGQPNKD